MIGKPLTGWSAVIALGVTGFFIVGIVSAGISKSELSLETRIITYPAAYELPKIPGVTSFRMAMLHDVLLDRYLHHGEAWYMNRNQAAKTTIDRLTTGREPPDALSQDREDLYNAMDDLAVGLENLHRSDDAAAVMRRKLELLLPIHFERPPPSHAANNADEETDDTQQISVKGTLSQEMHHQYTARANLGTSLIHGSFAKALAGDAATRKSLEEGLELIRDSIAINPSAHFGRERWQAIVVQHFLASMDDPKLLTDYDMIGNSMDQPEPRLFNTHAGTMVLRGMLLKPVQVMEQLTLDERTAYRNGIPKTGIDPEWAKRVQPDYSFPVPFDEPALGLMGMWMFGAGPNPNSSLALAHIAEQLGQLEIAFDAYERALELQDKFPPDEKIRTALVDHCKSQQALIAAVESPNDPDAWVNKTRKRHQEELAWAHTYQKEYQDYEAAQISLGIPLDDPHFYDTFFKTHLSISSPVGHADEVEVHIFNPNGPLDALPAAALLGGGLFTCLAALTTKRPPISA